MMELTLYLCANSQHLFMQGTNLLIYYLFDFVLYFNAIYVYYDNCI